MSKQVDSNGYWSIKHNPISKEGVFEYLGRSISSDCIPDKIYKVYRSAETLANSVDTWDNPPKPLIEDHEMLGEGFTDIDDRPMQGIIYNPVYEDGVLYADLAVYTESMKNSIEHGKKELSLGYFCNYKKESGVFNGQVYDYVQTDMVGNHIALVNAGRCGSDIKVFDHSCAMDSLDISGEFEEGDSNLQKNAEDAIIGTTEQKDSEMEKEKELEIKEEVKDECEKEVAEVKDEEIKEEVKEEIKSEDSAEEEKPEAKAEDEAESEEKAEDECEKPAEDECSEEKKAEDSDDLKEIVSLLREIKAALADKATDEEEVKEEEKAEDESEAEAESEKEEAKAEDEDEAKEEEPEDKKPAGDEKYFVFGQDGAESGEDEALKEYLA